MNICKQSFSVRSLKLTWRTGCSLLAQGKENRGISSGQVPRQCPDLDRYEIAIL